MGPYRDLVSHFMVHIRNLPASALERGMVGKEDRLVYNIQPVHSGILGFRCWIRVQRASYKLSDIVKGRKGLGLFILQFIMIYNGKKNI